MEKRTTLKNKLMCKCDTLQDKVGNKLTKRFFAKTLINVNLCSRSVHDVGTNLGKSRNNNFEE